MSQLSPSSNSEQVAELVAPNHSTGQKRSNGRLKKLRFILPLGLLLVAAGLGLRYRLTQTDERAIALSGRIESYESDLGAKVGGRVVSIAVREGDEVTQGQVIAKLDDSETRAQLDAAKARVSAAEQQITQAELQIEVVASQVTEAQLTLEQSQGDTTGRMS
ncbi:MAG: biotin/lipoyl-binding protein [Cyanobacteria bacterium J06555_13]